MGIGHFFRRLASPDRKGCHTRTRLLLAAMAVLMPLVLAVVASFSSSAAADASSRGLGVEWHAPFFSGGGYCSEATSFVLGLGKSGAVDVRIAQHGDSFSDKYVRGMPPAELAVLRAMSAPSRDRRRWMAICHSEPGAWHLPPNHPARYWSGSRCPGGSGGGANAYAYRVGRTMFETDRLPDGWADRLNAMDEVWVPSDFARRVFAEGGVAKEKLQVLGQPVDADFFSPDTTSPLPLPGPGFTLAQARDAAAGSAERGGPYRFRFLSIFKWEERKGWDVLLRAFLSEFATKEEEEGEEEEAGDVVLYLLTNAYHSSHGRADFEAEVAKVRAELELVGVGGSGSTGTTSTGSTARLRLPDVVVLEPGLPQSDLPRLYKAADAFVLPSRGEGWGRPHVEAMAMALPVLATNWSGSTAFLRDDNSYPIRVERFVPAGPWKGHRWAEPSVAHLRASMRHVVEHPGEARARGAAARRMMVEQFSQSQLAGEILGHVERIATKLGRDGGRGHEL